MGRFFQNTINAGILSVIQRIHDKEIPRYDRRYTHTTTRLSIIRSSLLMEAWLNPTLFLRQRSLSLVSTLREGWRFRVRRVYYRMKRGYAGQAPERTHDTSGNAKPGVQVWVQGAADGDYEADDTA